MKKFVAVIILFAILTFSASAEIYPQTFVVSDVDYSTDTMVLTDYNGFEWIYEGVEDLFIGDIISAIMEDNNTDIIFDDEIIKIRYASYMEGWE